MPVTKLLPSQVWRAIELYLGAAYAGQLPSAVRSKLETLKSVSPEDFFNSSVFERDRSNPPDRYSIRLGNRFYPHMKLALVRSPDKTGFLFQADTHDRHCCPESRSREHADFCKLMESNQALASSIETLWAGADLPTFKTFLRDDLARRRRKDELSSNSS